MQQSYVVSNKENDSYPQRSPLKLKTTYQVRESYHQRSKSPLGEMSSNRKFNFAQSKESQKSQLIGRKRDFNYKYTDESTTHQLNHQMINNVTSHHRQLSSDMSKIKPFSMESQRLGEKDYRKTYEPESVESRNPGNQYSTFSRSVHRQNAKHLGFVAKVDNLQKINHQISNLLSYVNENQSSHKDTSFTDGASSSSYKPRYENISDNSKSYQRRLNVLQKPKGHEPFISAFDTENATNIDISQNRHQARGYNKQYTRQDQMNKSPYRFKDAQIQEQGQRKTPKSTMRRDLSSQNVENRLNTPTNLRVSPLTSAKSQQFTRLLTPSQSQQKLSKLTTGNNPDLQFYYESLKNRDLQIEKFSKKIDDSNKNPYKQSYQPLRTESIRNQPSLSNLTPKDRTPLNRTFEYEERSFSKHQERSFKKDPFVTQQEIEIYKDVNRNQQSANNGRMSSTKRIQRLRAQIDRSVIQPRQSLPSDAATRQFTYERRERNNTNIDVSVKKSTYTGNSTGKNIQKSNKLQQPLNSKIQDQIRKIQNELKDCKKEKSYLREKYGNLLSKEKINQQQEIYQNHPNAFQETQNPKKIEQTYDRERMYDSSFDKINRPYLPNMANQIEQELQKDLRNRMISQNQRRNRTQNLVGNYEDSNKSASKYHKEEKSYDKGLGLERKSYLAQKNIKTEKAENYNNERRERDFEIMLQQVQISKPQTGRLGTLLAEKIEIDMKLRLKRQDFSRNKNSNKWDNLKSYMSSRYGIEKSSKQWQQLLNISPEEHNPFSPTQMSQKLSGKFGQSQGESSENKQLSSLCSLLSESLNHFQSSLLHRLSGQKLKREHFSFKELDLSSKGFLSVEDMICFVNLQSGKFYRNRDIIFLLKSMMLFHNNTGGIECYSSTRGSNEYKFSYDFLWAILTDSS